MLITIHANRNSLNEDITKDDHQIQNDYLPKLKLRFKNPEAIVPSQVGEM